ncbi:MAG: ral secretion pathway protein GspJ [Sphingomonas bacterium]|uniref:type II secretion system minor pseudopilin GspJ n=1 Tax=Sphingomonas bacterium TaxID=1895847 RepID=UPI0026292ADA|nr:type II secretion system minor pseudopilin GspJ [Sphingomonas bacterium]MDB5695365.1 ral secretion pathway protein GspJ [Sphingomonas bacterium]
MIVSCFPSPANAGAQRKPKCGAGAPVGAPRRRWAPASVGEGQQAEGQQAEGRACQGFTLVEVMVALLIFSIIATAGVALLSFSVRAQAASGARLDDLAALQRTLSILSADLAQATARPVRDEAGTVLPAFVGENGGGQPQNPAMLRLVRGGWTNLDAQPRAGAQKVAYQLADGDLQRIAYPRLDGAVPLPAAPLLTRVEGVAIRYRYRGAWSDRWDGSGGIALPQALELRLTRAGVEYRQLFLVGTGYVRVPEVAIAPG